MNPDLDAVPQSRLVLGSAVPAIVLGALTVSFWWFTNIGLLLVTIAAVAAIAVTAQRLVQSAPHRLETQPDAGEQRRGADSRVATLRHQIEQAGTGEHSALRAVHSLVTDLADGGCATGGDRQAHRPRRERPARPDLAAYLDQHPTGRLTADRRPPRPETRGSRDRPVLPRSRTGPADPRRGRAGVGKRHPPSSCCPGSSPAATS